MRRSRIRDPTWQSIASVVDPLFRLAMLFIPARPIPPRLTSLAAAWIPCIKQFWLHRKMRVREANAAIGESREQCCPEPAGNPNPARCKRAQCIPCASSATQIRPTSRWQRAPRDCAGLAIVCRPVMAAANRNQTPVKVRPRKGWVGPPRAAAARDRSSSSADPPPKHPSEIPEAVSSLIGGRVTF